MTRPLSITTTTHALVLAAYAAMAAQGVWFAQGTASARGLTELLGHAGLFAYGIVLLLSGCGALAAAAAAPFLRIPTAALVAEGCAVLIAAALNGLYWWTLRDQGQTFAISTQTYAVAFALGGALRVLQIAREVVKLTRSQRNPQPADPPLADPADLKG